MNMACNYCSTYKRPDEHGNCIECGARYDGQTREGDLAPRSGEEEHVPAEMSIELNTTLDSEGAQLNFFGPEGRRGKRAA